MLRRLLPTFFAGAGALTALLLAPCAFSDSWQANIYETGAPRHVVGVDKKKRVFNFFEKKSPFRLRYSYPCVTGQLPGDKQQVNDLRTPEGIYFVEYKIANGLDFREYGGIAYTLNYPNPVDRLRGKTGHGIWIHSKGFGLTPTRGCVAINLDNISEVGPYLLPGTPVVLAEELQKVEKDDNGNLKKLRDLMAAWCDAWAARSASMFDFYDPASYTKATEDFNLFRKNKERLFGILSFIKIYNREIHAMEGPGYWVTWTEQLYTASNLSTEGIRRLYWQKDQNDDFRIVGMEWTPHNLGMATARKRGALVAHAPETVMTDAAAEAPQPPRLQMPEQAETPAPEPEIMAETPGQPIAPTLAASTSVAHLEPPAAPEPARSRVLPDPLPAPLEKRPTPALRLPPEPMGPIAEAAQPLTDSERAEIAALTAAWQKHLQARSNQLDSLYDPKIYNRLPPTLKAPRGQSLAQTLQAAKRDFRQPWLQVVSRPPKIGGTPTLPHAELEMLIITPQGMRQGVQNLWWHKNAQGEYKIAASEFRPKSLGLDADYLERISTPIAKTLEDWRKAWAAGDLERYISFYARNATQQRLTGAASIRRQKQSLWERVHPVEVELSGLRIHLTGSGAKADMNQVYVNSAGHRDKGVKTLELKFDGENWRIQRESWAPAPDA